MHKLSMWHIAAQGSHDPWSGPDQWQAAPRLIPDALKPL